MQIPAAMKYEGKTYIEPASTPDLVPGNILRGYVYWSSDCYPEYIAVWGLFFFFFSSAFEETHAS